MDSQRFFTGFGLLSVSLVVHGSAFFTMDRVASHYQIHMAQEQRRLQREKDGPIQFEFVEAPRALSSRKPEHSKRVSNRDALNQDLLQDKTHTAIRPRTELQGHADQLAQQQSSFSQAPSPQILPRQEVPAPQEEKPIEKNVIAGVQPPFLEDLAKQSKLDNPVAAPYLRPRLPAGRQVRNDVIRNPQLPQLPMKPKAEIKGAAGVDKITTQEMSKIKSPAAQLFGQTSFEATGSGMGEYMKNLKEKIWLAWFPYLAYQYPQDFRGADVIVSFTLDPKGQVKIVQLVDSVGSPVFASFCMEAVQRASGFGPVPKEILALIGKDELEIKFGFHYR